MRWAEMLGYHLFEVEPTINALKLCYIQTRKNVYQMPWMHIKKVKAPRLHWNLECNIKMVVGL